MWIIIAKGPKEKPENRSQNTNGASRVALAASGSKNMCSSPDPTGRNSKGARLGSQTRAEIEMAR